MMSVLQKPHSEQRLYEILENCKQIPKDDRLFLRKYIKEGDKILIDLLSMPITGNSKTQVKLRKHLGKLKQNKRGMDHTEMRKNSHQENRIKSPANSVEKMKKSMELYQNLLTFKENMSKDRKEKVRDNQKMISEVRTGKKIIYMGSEPTSRIKFAATHGDLPETDRILKDQEDQENLFTSPELLDWDNMKNKGNIESIFDIPKAISRGNSPLKFNENSNLSSPVVKSYKFSAPSITFQCQINKINFSSPHNNHNNKNKKQGFDLYEIKSVLLKYYAEDLFEHIAEKYFPSKTNEAAVYLSYKKLLEQIQAFLRTHNEEIEIISENSFNFPVLEPFTNQFESVNLKNLGTFLDKFCLRKTCQTRNQYIIMDTLNEGFVSIDKFKRSHSWKGNELIEIFENIVRRWGDGDRITYWQLYRIRNEKQFSALRQKF